MNLWWFIQDLPKEHTLNFASNEIKSTFCFTSPLLLKSPWRVESYSELLQTSSFPHLVRNPCIHSSILHPFIGGCHEMRCPPSVTLQVIVGEVDLPSRLAKTSCSLSLLPGLESSPNLHFRTRLSSPQSPRRG